MPPQSDGDSSRSRTRPFGPGRPHARTLPKQFTMSWNNCKRFGLFLICLPAALPAAAQSDTLFLPVERLFELGVRHNLALQADALEERSALERERGARAERLPDLQVGLRGGYAGRPTVFRQGLAGAYHPDAPDWSQNYAVDLSQPIYRGGKLRYAVRKAGMERSLAALRTEADAADIRLALLEQYMQLFELYRRQEVFSRNIEESERRLHDIRRMKEEELLEVADQLQESAAGFQSFSDWFAHMEEYGKELEAQARTQTEPDPDRDGVALMTMHGSKGLEYRIVYIIDANEGITPHRKAVLEAEAVTEKQVEEAKKRRERAELTLRKAASESQEYGIRSDGQAKLVSALTAKLLEGDASAEESAALEKNAPDRRNIKEQRQWVSLAIGACLTMAEEISKERARLEREAEELERNKTQQDSLRKKWDEQQEGLRELRPRAQEAAIRSSRIQVETEQLRKNLLWESRSDAERELERLVNERVLLEQSAGEAKDKADRIKSSITQKEAYLSSEREREAVLGRKVEENRKKWQEALKKNGFATEEEYRNSVLTDNEIAMLSEDMERFNQELLKARTIFQQLRMAAKKLTRVEESELLKERDMLTDEKAKAAERAGLLSARRIRNEGAYRNLQKLMEERRKLKEEKQQIEILYTTADGKVTGSARIDFQTYIQRQYFRQMIHAANKRLCIMTDNQFLLQCRDMELLGMKGEVGLDLDVYSMSTDRTRDVKTLSGGESFMASLSLALGLSDEIQESAGGVQLDVLFVDEGFGSLDEETLDQAMKAIQTLAEDGGRIVGIISHVTELQNRIDRQLLVRKMKSGGSTATINIL